MAQTWTSGKSVYKAVHQDGVDYAVLEGKSVADRDCVFIVKADPKTNRHFFVQATTRAKDWELPDIVSKGTSSSRSYEDRVKAMYEKYAPEKVGNVSVVLEKYAGHEEQLLADLVTKYGAEPDVGAAAETGSVSSSASFYLSSPPPGLVAAGSGGRSYRDRVTAIYAKYKPNKVSSVDRSLEQYKGQEEALIKVLCEKFGPEPEVEGAAAGGSAAGAAGGRTYRERVYALYEKYKPNKLHTVDKALEQYKGQEELLIKTLVDKLGPEPEAPAPAAAARAAATETTENETTEPSQPQQEAVPSSANEQSATAMEQSQPADSAETQQQRHSTEESKQAQGGSTFDFGSPEQNAAAEGRPAPLPAFNPEEYSEKDQERLLVTFIHDRDERLKVAHDRTEHYTALLDQLRKQNVELVQQLNQIQGQADSELQGMRCHATKLADESSFAKQAWELEREKLQAQADVANLVAEKTVQAEKVQFEEDRATFQRERAALQTSIAELETELQLREQKASKLLEMLDGKDNNVRHLNAELSELKSRVRPSPSNHVLVQTEAMTAMSDSPQIQVQHPDGGAQEQQDDDDDLFAEYEALMSSERARGEEVNQLRQRAKELEREVSRLRTALGSSRKENAACEECVKRNKVIAALRNKTKALEDRAMELELALLAQPDAPIPNQMAPEDLAAEKLHLQSQINVMQKELSQAKSTARTQKREIADLRGLLAMHMSSPAGGLRTALGADRSKSNSSKSPSVGPRK